MSEDANKDEGSTEAPPAVGAADLEAVKSEHASALKALEARVMKAEEAAGYAQRELEKTRSKAEERDKILKERAAAGDEGAANKLADEEKKTLLNQLEEYRLKVDSLTEQQKQGKIIDQVMPNLTPHFSNSGFAQTALREAVHKHCHVDETTGGIVFRDENGNPLMSQGSYTEPMKSEEFVEYLRQQMPDIALSRKVNGVVEPGQRIENTGTVGALNVYDLSKLSPADQRAALNRMSDEEAKALAKQIGF